MLNFVPDYEYEDSEKLPEVQPPPPLNVAQADDYLQPITHTAAAVLPGQQGDYLVPGEHATAADQGAPVGDASNPFASITFDEMDA